MSHKRNDGIMSHKRNDVTLSSFRVPTNVILREAKRICGFRDCARNDG